ncbi:MAG: hypothetical protein EOP88_17045 [Verrucomicrobiaceae bacterium]|nr:MAG: hypothetical protein EOP88_17045 [Verrucomicrobiaceae bacterium]
MRKTTAKYWGSIILWLVMVSPMALVLGIEKRHPDFEEQVDHYTFDGPLWNLAMWMSAHCLVVIWLGAVLVALAVWRWRRTAIACRVLLGLVALASSGAAVVVAVKYVIHYNTFGTPAAWWLKGTGIDGW